MKRALFKRTGVDMRDTIASAVALGIRRQMAQDVKIDQGKTTSDCPMLTLTLRTGDVYNLTITKARKKKP